MVFLPHAFCWKGSNEFIEDVQNVCKSNTGYFAFVLHSINGIVVAMEHKEILQEAWHQEQSIIIDKECKVCLLLLL